MRLVSPALLYVRTARMIRTTLVATREEWRPHGIDEFLSVVSSPAAAGAPVCSVVVFPVAWAHACVHYFRMSVLTGFGGSPFTPLDVKVGF